MNLIGEMEVLFELLGLTSRKSLTERLAERFVEAVEQVTGSVGGTAGRAAEYADEARRRTGTRLREAGERARGGARAGRDAFSERVDAVQRRAVELREGRERRRESRSQVRAERRRRRHRHRERPMQFNVCRDDRIVLRGRSPIDVRLDDGGKVRYRYHERPSFWLRTYLHLTGRQVWPRR